MAKLPTQFKKEVIEKAKLIKKQIGKKYYNHLFKNKTRIRLPYKIYHQNTGILNIETPPPPTQIANFLYQHDYYIDKNYLAYTDKNPHNKIKVGRVLNTLFRKGYIEEQGYKQLDKINQKH